VIGRGGTRPAEDGWAKNVAADAADRSLGSRASQNVEPIRPGPSVNHTPGRALQDHRLIVDDRIAVAIGILDLDLLRQRGQCDVARDLHAGLRLLYPAPMKKALAVLATVFIGVLAASPLCAADLTGIWNAEFHLGDTKGTPVFTLKQNGKMLTGTYSGALGEAPVRGTVEGSKVTIDFDAEGTPIRYVGEVDRTAKKIEGTADYDGASGTFIAIRK
jgi:hypothetical protein